MRYLLLLLLLAGCSASQPEQAEPDPGKVIIKKHEAVEQRLTWDPFDKNSIRDRAQTVYYLFADDGTFTEVTMREYMRAEEGQRWQAKHWKK